MAALGLFWACDDDPGTPDPTGTSQGMGGCHTGPPDPLFTLKVRQMSADPLPTDTAVTVNWSAGEELFALNDMQTWKTLEDGTNVECKVDRAGPVPQDLTELECELWTNGATEVTVAADGFVTVIETYQPMEIEGCMEPVPQTVEVEMVLDLDAGRR